MTNAAQVMIVYETADSTSARSKCKTLLDLLQRHDLHRLRESAPAQRRAHSLVVATGSPQDESVHCADLWPIPFGALLLQLDDGSQGRGYSSVT
jgi:hypothetical protein